MVELSCIQYIGTTLLCVSHTHIILLILICVFFPHRPNRSAVLSGCCTIQFDSDSLPGFGITHCRWRAQSPNNAPTSDANCKSQVVLGTSD